MFQRRHYKTIAKIIKSSSTRDNLIVSLINFFSDDNPNFDPERFIKACDPN